MKRFILNFYLVAASVVAVALTPAAQAAGCVIAGPDNAPVTIEEYADFYCKYCQIGSNTMKEVLKNYPDKVRLVFRNMPLGAHKPNALTAAKAFSAIWLQSPALAFSFQEQLFDHQDDLIKNGDSFLFETATNIGADVAQMKLDMLGKTVAGMIADDQQAAESHGFRGTPSFMIGTEAVTGSRPYDEIKSILDKQLGK